MKKLAYLVIAIAAFTFAACDGNQKKAAGDVDSADVEAVESADATDLIKNAEEKLNAGDEEGVKAVVAEVEEKVQKLVDEGKVEEAKDYMAKFKDFLNEKKEDLAKISPALNEHLKGIADKGDEVLNKFGEAAEQLKNDALDKKDEFEDAAKQKAEDMKAAADEKIEETKAKVEEKFDEKVKAAEDNAKEKANKAIDDAANEIKGKLGL